MHWLGPSAVDREPASRYGFACRNVRTGFSRYRGATRYHPPALSTTASADHSERRAEIRRSRLPARSLYPHSRPCASSSRSPFRLSLVVSTGASESSWASGCPLAVRPDRGRLGSPAARTPTRMRRHKLSCSLLFRVAEIGSSLDQGKRTNSRAVNSLPGFQ